MLAREENKTIEELLREAVIRVLENEEIYPNDPIFTEPPIVQENKKNERTSETHDKIVYEK